jgi:hypothetical protein
VFLNLGNHVDELHGAPGNEFGAAPSTRLRLVPLPRTLRYGRGYKPRDRALGSQDNFAVRERG